MNEIRLAVIVTVISFVMTVSGALAMGSKQGQSDRTQNKEIAASVQNYQQMVREAIDGMIEAYSSKNGGRFMTFVSENFAGDNTVLDRAVRRDFSLYTNVDIRYTFNNVTADSSGKLIYASIMFNRSHTVIKTGNQAKSSGTTDFVFRIVNNKAELYSMKAPLIFGLSDPSVATGK